MPEPQATTPTLTTTPKAALYAALARAQGSCRSAELDGRFTSPKVNYPFTSAQERMAVARDALAENGLALIRKGMPRLVELSGSRELVDTTTGEARVEVYAIRMYEADYLLTHEDGGDLELGARWPVVEGPGRPLDKAWAGADTSGLSYLIRDVLLIPSEEADDAKEREGTSGKIVQMPSRPPAPAPTLPKPTTQPAATEAVKSPATTTAQPPAADPEQKQAQPAAGPAPLALPVAGPDVFDQQIAAGSLGNALALEEQARKKLAAAPLVAAKLYAAQPGDQDKSLWLEIFAVAEKRFGSRETAISKAKELGVPQGTVPTVALLRKFVEVMP